MVRVVWVALACMVPPAAVLAEPAPAEARYAIEDTLVTDLAAADGHAYRIFVAWPATPPPPQGWPVLYVLDGEDNFAVAVQTARRLAKAGARSGIVPGLVVAVESGGLPRRVLDYTPAAPGYAIPAGAPAHGLATGGGDAFLDFLKDRVQPMIAKRWRVDAARQTLLGHSFGGLLALHSMLGRSDPFRHYVAVSPSLWFGNDLIGREARAFAPRGATLLIATGSDERGADGGGSAEALAAGLAAKGVAARSEGYSGQSHGTTMLAAMGAAVAVAFGPEAAR